MLCVGITNTVLAQNTKENTTTPTKDAITTILNRKSVREFTGKMLTNETLDTLAKAGMAAPSAMNKQPWVFILINDRKTLNLMADSLPSAKMLYKAGGAIVVCGDQKKNIAGNELFWVEDCAAASQNILIAVESLELGAVWTGVFPDNKKMATVRTILEIPSDVIPLNVIAIGYPSGKDVPKNKYKKENIHWNKW
ncbi:MAG: nitroreductase family protein [Bacteroidetes bacterium]|nr:nitroreductase family protein [Bacteroidota bacterium]